MANSRIPDLAQIYSNQLIDSDLLLLEDMSVPNGVSKKLELSDFSDYLLGNFKTGSLYGTASWAVSSSWAPYQISASYSNTSSLAWNAISASYALNCLSASYAKSSSYAITASYAITSSFYLVVSSGFANNADYAKSASYLIYTPGIVNGTASFALTSSRAISSNTSSYLQYNSIPNGTASFALTASQTISSSYLNFNGNNNGTASYAIAAGNADTVTLVTTIKNDYIYREHGPYDCSLLNSDITASIGAFIINSSANNPTAIIEAWGDVKMISTSSLTESASLTLNISDVDFPISIDLDKSTYYNFVTSSTSSQTTSSIIVPTYLKGTMTTMGHLSASIFKSGPIEFYTGSRPFRMVIKINGDTFTMD